MEGQELIEAVVKAQQELVKRLIKLHQLQINLMMNDIHARVELEYDSDELYTFYPAVFIGDLHDNKFFEGSPGDDHVEAMLLLADMVDAELNKKEQLEEHDE